MPNAHSHESVTSLNNTKLDNVKQYKKITKKTRKKTKKTGIIIQQQQKKSQNKTKTGIIMMPVIVFI